MITIDQLLESVDLDFEPRWVTKDEGGWLAIWEEKPHCCSSSGMWQNDESCFLNCGYIKLAEFAHKDWTECIYEVPRKTTGKIEKIHIPEMDEVAESAMYSKELAKLLNQVIDTVNELKGEKNE